MHAEKTKIKICDYLLKSAGKTNKLPADNADARRKTKIKICDYLLKSAGKTNKPPADNADARRKN